MNDVEVVVSGARNSFSDRRPRASAAGLTRHSYHQQSARQHQQLLQTTDGCRTLSADVGARYGSWQDGGGSASTAGSRSDTVVAADYGSAVVDALDHGALRTTSGALGPSVSTSGGKKSTSGYSFKQNWRLKYQDFLPEKSAKQEPFQ